MALDQVYAAGAIDVEGTILRAASDVNENPNITLIQRRHAGRIDWIYSATGQVAPTITFNTPECGIGLALVTKHGKVLAASTVYYTKRTPVAQSAGADHLKSSMTGGIIVPRTLAWAGGAGLWIAGFEFFPISSDGLIAPIIPGTAALPALAVIPETFTGGKLIVNTVELDCWQTATYDFGITAAHRHHKGLPAPLRAFTATASPMLRISNLNPADRAVFGQFGTRITACDLYLRKNMVTAGEVPTRELDASLVHTRIRMVDGIVYPGVTAAPEEGDMTQEIVLSFQENATTAAVQITTGVAIP